MNAFDLPKEGSGTPVVTRCPCGTERTDKDLLCPLVAGVRRAKDFDGLETAFVQVRVCCECGTLYVRMEAHPTQ